MAKLDTGTSDVDLAVGNNLLGADFSTEKKKRKQKKKK